MIPDDIEADYWAHHFAANPVTDSGEDEEFDTDKLVQAIEDGEWEDIINE